MSNVVAMGMQGHCRYIQLDFSWILLLLLKVKCIDEYAALNCLILFLYTSI